MGTFGQPTHDDFRANDRHRVAFWIAINGGANVKPAGFQELLAGGKVSKRVCDVFDHFHVDHHIKLLSRVGQSFGSGIAIVDGEAGLFCMHLCDRDIALGRICANDGCTEAGYGFALIAFGLLITDGRLLTWILSKRA